MSWSANTPSPVAKSDIATSIVGTPQTNPEGVEDAYADALAIATEAAERLAAAVGRDDDLVHVSLSGHANPDHAPAAGWSDEFISISVQARPRKAEPTDDPPAS